MELRSIGVLSCGKLLGAIYAALGLLIGGFMAVISLADVAGQPQGPDANGPAFMVGMGVGALIFAPVLYGILGFIGGIISAGLYNFFAGMIGGIELNFEQQQNHFE